MTGTPGHSTSARVGRSDPTSSRLQQLPGVLGEAAVSAGKTDTFLRERCRRIARRRGKKEAFVPRIVAHHDVKDRAHWLASPLREQVFGPLGVHNIRTYTDPNSPVHVSLTADVDDMDAFGAFMQSEAAAEAMASDGVLPETVVVLIEA